MLMRARQGRIRRRPAWTWDCALIIAVCGRRRGVTGQPTPGALRRHSWATTGGGCLPSLAIPRDGTFLAAVPETCWDGPRYRQIVWRRSSHGRGYARLCWPRVSSTWSFCPGCLKMELGHISKVQTQTRELFIMRALVAISVVFVGRSRIGHAAAPMPAAPVVAWRRRVPVRPGLTSKTAMVVRLDCRHRGNPGHPASLHRLSDHNWKTRGD